MFDFVCSYSLCEQNCLCAWNAKIRTTFCITELPKGSSIFVAWFIEFMNWINKRIWNNQVQSQTYTNCFVWVFGMFWMMLILRSVFTPLMNLMAPSSGWWKWTCPLQMTTVCTSPLPWWLWSALLWRSNWHQVSLVPILLSKWLCNYWMNVSPSLSFERVCLSLFHITLNVISSWWRDLLTYSAWFVLLLLLVPFPLFRAMCVGWCV